MVAGSAYPAPTSHAPTPIPSRSKAGNRAAISSRSSTSVVMPSSFRRSAFSRTCSSSSGGWRKRNPVGRNSASWPPVISGNRLIMAMLSLAQRARNRFV